MSDLVIAEEDGWFEVSEIVRQMRMDAQKELWGYVGKGDTENAADLLDMEVGEPLEDLFGTAPVEGVKALSVPDDILGERLRIWVLVGRAPGKPEEAGV